MQHFAQQPETLYLSLKIYRCTMSIIKRPQCYSDSHLPAQKNLHLYGDDANVGGVVLAELLWDSDNGMLRSWSARNGF